MPAATRAKRVLDEDEIQPMSDEELARLRIIEGLPDVSEGEVQQDMTEAELALLELRGMRVEFAGAGGFEQSNPDARRNGEILFKVGYGDSEFSGRLLQKSPNKEKVWMWRISDGVKRAIRRDAMEFYIAERRLSPRPIPGKTDAFLPEFKCPMRGETGEPCRKMMYTPEDVDDHCRRAHTTAYKQRERHRQLRRDEQLEDFIDRVSASASGGGGNEALIAAIALLTERIGQVGVASAEES